MYSVSRCDNCAFFLTKMRVCVCACVYLICVVCLLWHLKRSSVNVWNFFFRKRNISLMQFHRWIKKMSRKDMPFFSGVWHSYLEMCVCLFVSLCTCVSCFMYVNQCVNGTFQYQLGIMLLVLLRGISISTSAFYIDVNNRPWAINRGRHLC